MWVAGRAAACLAVALGIVLEAGPEAVPGVVVRLSQTFWNVCVCGLRGVKSGSTGATIARFKGAWRAGGGLVVLFTTVRATFTMAVAGQGSLMSEDVTPRRCE